MYFGVFSVKFFVLLLFICVPHILLAQVEITEVMYDHEGTDSGFEWVEIYNSGSSDIDIGSWYFFENDTYHGLTPDGFVSIGAGERALIVQNLENIYAEFGSSLNLVKSSFSLNNTGETIALADQNRTTQDEITYSADGGALGNGNSIQLTNGIWIEALPTPGSVNAREGDPGDTNNATTSSSSTSTTKKEVVVDDYYTGYLTIEKQAISGSPTNIEAYVVHTRNGQDTKLKRGVFYLNFGDGSVYTSDERFETQHVYQYPGEYQVVLEYYRSMLAQEAGEDPKVMINKRIQVHDHVLSIVAVDGSGGVTIHNGASIPIDLDGWSLVYDNHTYTFPRYLMLASQGEVTIPRTIHNLGYVHAGSIRLLNEIGEIMQVGVATPPIAIYSEHVEGDDTLEEVPITSDATTALVNFLAEHPDKQVVDFGEASQSQNQTQGDQSTHTSRLFIMTLVVGVVALLLVLIRARYRTSQIDERGAELQVIGDIELIE